MSDIGKKCAGVEGRGFQAAGPGGSKKASWRGRYPGGFVKAGRAGALWGVPGRFPTGPRPLGWY